jgi:chromosome partitioning protein
VRLSEAPSHGVPISGYAPTSRGADAYRALADEFRLRLGLAAAPEPTADPVEAMVLT